MCEQIAETLRIKHPEKCFMVGLFSVLDSILDRPLEQILHSLSLSPEVAEALIDQKNQFGQILQAVQAYERKDWKLVSGSLKLDAETVRQMYVDALAWSMRTLNGVSGASPLGRGQRGERVG